MKFALLVCFVFLGNCAAQVVIQLEPQYTTPSPGTLSFSQTGLVYQMNTCTSGGPVTFTLEAVLPYAAWNGPLGNFLQIAVYDANQQCQVMLCQNNPQLNGICIFTSSSNKFIITVQNTIATSLPFSFNVVTGNPTNGTVYTPSKSPLTVCPSNPINLQQVIQVNQAQSVATSNTNGLNFAFSLCSATSPTVSISYNALVTTPGSAISTFLCATSPCLPGNSFLSDRSGSGYNTINTGNLVGTYGLFIQGWGLYQGTNTFVFSIHISN